MAKPGTVVEQSGIYWCSVCKLPVSLQKGDTFPTCANKCGRCTWQFVRTLSEE